MRTTKHNYKDSLFRDIFNNVDRLTQVCAALLDIRAKPSDIKLATIEETLFNGIKNDVAFLVGNEYVLLTEHQTTLNRNMPLRFFMYLAEIYRRYVDKDAVYKRKLLPLPAPRFYVFYNGLEEMPDTWTLRLSDAFEGRRGALDLVAEVFNINDKPNRPILGKCHALKSYSVFVAKVRERVESGSTLEIAVGDAVSYCIAHDYLKEYFRLKKEREVFDMLNFVWDQERAMKVRAEEAAEEAMEKGLLLGREEGLSQGLSQGVLKTTIASLRQIMKSFNVPMEKAMDVLQIPAAERDKYAALVKD